MIFFIHRFSRLSLKIFSVVTTLLLAGMFTVPASAITEEQESYIKCTDFMFVFARGSGAELNSDRDFKPFKAAVDEVFGNSGYTYDFYEVGSTEWRGYKYSAPGIGISSWERFTTSLGALFSGGEENNYGDSVYAGTIEVKSFIRAMVGPCPNTKIVLAGYSQGAQVISSALKLIESPDSIFAALTFGDPKLYLPEGKMNFFTRTTAACKEKDLSDYRAYVPDCYAYQGILGGYKPYQPSSGFSGKLKAYCQFHDVICSSTFFDLDKIVSGHATYAEQGTYKRAIEDVYNMIEPNTYVRPSQDVAILFDVTGSMEPLLKQFKNEAIAVAKRTTKKGGKVALYTYGDLAEVKPVQLCNFETCDSENVEEYIKNLEVKGGDDVPESLLSASYTLMRELKWDIGANKSLIVLTDANYHNPDRDGITEENVIELSKSIDPVNIYILTTDGFTTSYKKLAEETNGGVYTTNVASALEDIESEILSRNPEAIYVSTDLPEPDPASVSNLKIEKLSDSSVQLSFETDGVINFISLNDYIAGYTEEKSVTITDLDLSRPITICVSSASKTGYRGDAVCTDTPEIAPQLRTARVLLEETDEQQNQDIVIPKAPNTGRR